MDVTQLTRIAEQAREVKRKRMESSEDDLKGSSEAKANFVIAQIERRCLQEAHAGRNHAAIYALSPGQDYPPQADAFARLGAESLRGVGMLIHAAMKAANLEPTIEFWKGAETGAGFNLIAHWPKE